MLISNNHYGEGLDNLNGANYITTKLNDYFECIVDNPENDIMFLKDINYTDAINSIYNFIKKNDFHNCVFLFYFCGHGKISSNNMSELILALKDTTENNYDSIGIKFSSLVSKINELNIKRFICIIDSCCSGIINYNAMGNNEITVNEDDLIEGYVYISSVKGTLPAYEIEIKQQKLPWFSYCFWKALTDQSNNVVSCYSVEDIFTKTKQLVMERDNIDMEPQVVNSNFLYKEKIFPNISTKSEIDNTLDVIDWRITSDCNNKCPICYACKNVDELSEDKINIVINKLSKTCCKSICVSGGEPTKSKYFEKIMRKLYKNNFSLFLSTNGYKYMQFREEIEQYLEKLSLPLDGYDEQSNASNGRNADSFLSVKKILDYYNSHEHNFTIKISTVLTCNTNHINYLTKILEFLKNYNISIWKIYEFIPVNTGAIYKNNYSLAGSTIREVQKWVNKIRDNCEFKVELVRRKNRDAAYFIIQPNGDVIIPIEDGNDENVIEKYLGNILEDDVESIISKWKNIVNLNNYFLNLRLRKIKQLYLLKPNDKKLLYNIVSGDEIPSLKVLSDNLHEDENTIQKQINTLYEHRIIKNIIPIINLKIFGIKTFLSTLNFYKNEKYPEGYLEEYLCYNPHIGWVTKCENKTFRIAIFAKNQTDAINILDKIQKDLNNDVVYEIHDLRCSYAIAENNLLINIPENNSSINIYKYNSNEKVNFEEIKLTNDEFHALQQIENLRKPIRENINNKAFIKPYIDINENIISLQKKGIIEKLSVVLDTRLLGYDWYIFFVRISKEKIENLIDFLINKFNNITHINYLMPPNNSQWNLDFEVHVSSYVEINKLLEQIEQKFDDIKIDTPLKIIEECKFSFLTHSVSDIILKNYVLENTQEGNSL